MTLSLTSFNCSQLPLIEDPHSHGMWGPSWSHPCYLFCLIFQNIPSAHFTPAMQLSQQPWRHQHTSVHLFFSLEPLFLFISAQLTPIQPAKLSSSIPFSRKFPPGWLCPSSVLFFEDFCSIPGVLSLSNSRDDSQEVFGLHRTESPTQRRLNKNKIVDWSHIKATGM